MAGTSVSIPPQYTKTRPNTQTVATRRDATVDNLIRGHRVYDGCEVSASCLDCPLERCKYESPSNAQIARYRQILANRARREAGLSARQIAKSLGISARTVMRYIQLGYPADRADDDEYDPVWDMSQPSPSGIQPSIKPRAPLPEIPAAVGGAWLIYESG